MTKCYYSFIITFISLFSCGGPSIMEQTLELAGDNRYELEKVLSHYRLLGDERKLKAAEFLISNMGNKHSFEGEILTNYDTIFCVYDSLFKAKVYDREPQIITDTWNSLDKKYGPINTDKLQRVYDCQTLTADFLIQNIDEAFASWEKSPLYNPADFNLFCEYILPYRMANEIPEIYRKRYFEKLHHILDTITNPDGILQGFSTELGKNQHYVSSKVLWDYPVELPISKMEKIHKGACRHLTTFGALTMRACGLPVTVDRAIWANRSQGHSWNVLMLDSGKMLPFDALDKRRINFAYKPAKIFRKTYSLNFDAVNSLNKKDVPPQFFVLDEIDVTHEYVNAYDITIPIISEYKGTEKKELAVICVFDNKDWRIIHWGKIKSGKMYFNNMASDVAYIGGYYENGTVTPATRPFLLRSNGAIDYCEADESVKTSMRLERKYPNSKLMENRAHGLMEMTAEGSNNPDFKNPAIFFTQSERTYNVTDSFINNTDKFRYIRLNISKTRVANLAEVEFYGKKSITAPEEELSGRIFGFPKIEGEDNPYYNAIDGNLETFFEKDKRTNGWVGLDLGIAYYITRIRYCPRSDTNFILEGDTYELMYWSNNQWKSSGQKIATQYNNIVFDNVPTKTMYLLHNHTRGKEERIFTYEDGKQIWW